MASLVEVSSNTFLKVCDLQDDFYVQITFTFKIMDLPCFVFWSFNSYGRDEEIGPYMAEQVEFILPSGDVWLSVYCRSLVIVSRGEARASGLQFV